MKRNFNNSLYDSEVLKTWKKIFKKRKRRKEKDKSLNFVSGVL